MWYSFTKVIEEGYVFYERNNLRQQSFFFFGGKENNIYFTQFHIKTVPL